MTVSSENVVIVQEQSEMIYILSDAEAEIVRLISSGVNLENILRLLKAEYHADDGVIENDLKEFIALLIEANIAEWVVNDGQETSAD